MTLRHILATAAAAGASLALLTGCSTGPVTYTVPASLLATQAEDVLEDTVGVRPDVDCGVEDVELVEGQHLECVLTDPATDIRYSADITLTEVEGTEYKISVVGGSEPLD